MLRLAMEELWGNARLHTELGMEPKLPGRLAITGRRGQGVWDFLQLPDAKQAKKRDIAERFLAWHGPCKFVLRPAHFHARPPICVASVPSGSIGVYT